MRAIALAVVLLALAATAGEPALKRGPFVSFDEQGRVTVDALLNDDDDVALVTTAGTAKFEAVAGKRVRATLPSLPGGTELAAKIVGKGSTLAEWTLKVPPMKGRRLSFCALGDTGWLRTKTGTATDEQLAVARELVKQDPDLVLHTGDVIYLFGQAGSLDPLFFEPYRETLRRVPLFCTLGNHDTKTQDGKPELSAFPYPPNANGNRWYSFDMANVHFVSLDSNAIVDADSADAFRSTPQGRWLRTDLASATAEWKVIFFHHPLYSVCKANATDMARMREVLEPLLDEAKVDLVLAGHHHQYHRSHAVNGTVHVVTGGGGAPLYDRVADNPSWSAAFAKRFHLVRADVDGLEMRLRAIADDGSLLDEARLTSRRAR